VFVDWKTVQPASGTMPDFVHDTATGKFALESMKNERTKVTDLLFGKVTV